MYTYLKKIIVLSTILLLDVAYCPASTIYPLDHGKVVKFVNAPEAKQKILEDSCSAFFNALSALDICIRMQQKELTNEANRLPAYQQFLQNNVLDWQPEEISLLKKVLKDCQLILHQVNADLLPDTLYLVKTTGHEEANSDYTRDKVVYLPQSRFSDLVHPAIYEKLGKIIIHELFHIYSRYHPQKKEELYKTIGFSKVSSLDIGLFLSGRKLTNPDACDYNYKITVKDKDDRDIEVVIMVYSKYPVFTEGKDLKSHLSFSLFEIRQEHGNYKIVNGEQPTAIHPDEVRGFFEQVGRNTKYIVHPDEILADNLRLLVLSKLDQRYINHLNSEGVALLKKIESILRSN